MGIHALIVVFNDIRSKTTSPVRIKNISPSINKQNTPIPVNSMLVTNNDCIIESPKSEPRHPLIPLIAAGAAGTADAYGNYIPLGFKYRLAAGEVLTREHFRLKELYRGVGPVAAATVPSILLAVGVGKLLNQTVSKDSPAYARFLPEAVQGVLSALISGPVGNIIVTQQSLKLKPLEATRWIIENRGARGLLWGIEPLIIRETIYLAGTFTAMDAVKRFIAERVLLASQTCLVTVPKNLRLTPSAINTQGQKCYVRKGDNLYYYDGSKTLTKLPISDDALAHFDQNITDGSAREPNVRELKPDELQFLIESTDFLPDVNHPLNIATSGLMVGGIAALLSQPFDVAATMTANQKTRISRSPLSITAEAVKKHGYGRLFWGLAPRTVAVVAGVIVCSTVYSYIEDLLNEAHEKYVLPTSTPKPR